MQRGGEGRALKVNTEKERKCVGRPTPKGAFCVMGESHGTTTKQECISGPVETYFWTVFKRYPSLNSTKNNISFFKSWFITELWLANCLIWTIWWRFNSAPTDASLAKRNRLERQKSNNRRRLISQAFLMIGRRSPFCAVLNAGVSRCGGKIAVCVMAGLQVNVLISHVQYNIIPPCEAWLTELLISHPGSNWHLVLSWNFISFCCERSGRMTAANRQTQPDNLQFGVALSQLTRPSAGAAPSHIWRAWNRLHGTTVWRRLTQQSRHLAGPCERPAPVKQSQLAIRQRHWVWLSATSSLLHFSCLCLTQNCIGPGQLATPKF